MTKKTPFVLIIHWGMFHIELRLVLVYFRRLESEVFLKITPGRVEKYGCPLDSNFGLSNLGIYLRASCPSSIGTASSSSAHFPARHISLLEGRSQFCEPSTVGHIALFEP